MEILILLWLGTIIFSVSMEFANEMRMFKDVADNGYKIDIKRFSEFLKQINPNGSKSDLLSLLTIGVNMWFVLKQIIKYNKIRPMILTQLDVMDVLIEMTKEEKEEYQIKPTGLNALILTIKAEIKIETQKENVEIIKIIEGDQNSFISCKKDKNGNRTVISVEGALSKLPIEAQKAKIEEAIERLSEAFVRLSENEARKLCAKMLNKNEDGNLIIDLNILPKKKDDVISDSSVKTDLIDNEELNNITRQKQQLEQFRDYAVSSNSTPIEEEKGQSLSRK